MTLSNLALQRPVAAECRNVGADERMAWFSRKRELDPLKSERYRGRPLLILIENYVLHTIGELPPEKVDILAASIRRVWGGGPDWRATFLAVLDVNDAIDDDLRRLWKRNQELARERAEDLTPQGFARMIADENFAGKLARSE